MLHLLNSRRPFLIAVTFTLAALAAACGSSDDTLEQIAARAPGPDVATAINRGEAVNIAVDRFGDFIQALLESGTEDVPVSAVRMELGDLQNLMQDDSYSAGSEILTRTVWAVQITGAIPGLPSHGDDRWAVIGIDASDGATLIRGLYNRQVLPLLPG